MNKLDATSFIVLGEGLAAGMTNFSLMEVDQLDSFPSQMSRQMKVRFQQPLIQAPGIGDAPGFPLLPVRLPFDYQTTVLKDLPPTGENSNISVPGLRLSDALMRRPAPPLVRQDDALQTGINLILGIGAFIQGVHSPLPTQLEYALRQTPTLAIIELGFVEALEAAVSGRPEFVPEPDVFRLQYSELVTELRNVACTVVVTTIPDPGDTAHFSSLEAAARVLKVPVAMLGGAYGFQEDVRIAVEGLTEMGCQLFCKSIKPLPEGSTLPASILSDISGRINALNGVIVEVARKSGALVYDLRALYRALRQSGQRVGKRILTADFLGGFYSLNGYYPGKTGHALIANGILELLNSNCGSSFEPVDLEAIARRDPVAMYQQAEGPEFTQADINPPTGKEAQISAQESVQGASGPRPEHTVQVEERKPGLTRPYLSDPHGSWSKCGTLPLTLPPGLEQVLPLNKHASYYGDALRAVHTTDPTEVVHGLTGNLLFGGLAMLDSHLSGNIRIKFSSPEGNISHFEVTHGEGLVGDDGRLSAPQFLKLPGIMNKLLDPRDAVSSGDLDLTTGSVTNLQYRLYFMNSAIFALAQVNPSLPKEPIQFPGQYGTAWARFEQRTDGLLDFEFYGTTFIPMSVLGAPARFPLPFFSPNLNFASIPCDGTTLHPHIHLSTLPLEGPDKGVEVPDLPTNAIQVFAASTYSNYVGDDFSLNAPELGSPASGRSHLRGRYQVQFGERFGESISVSISSLPPGGLLTVLPQSPIAQAFQKRIPDSLLGHAEILRFKNQTYVNDLVSWLDDPLDIAHGAVDLKTGKVIGHLLRRGMITTSWILAMIRLEPRTPKSTFAFRGPASFEKSVNGETVFRYYGDLHIPFPDGYCFPAPDNTTPITIGPNSALDPFLRHQGIHSPGAPRIVKRGGTSQLTASNCLDFSFCYEIFSDAGKSSFEYTNITTGGTFWLKSLTWVGFFNSRTSIAAPGDYDTLSFTGFGSWSEDRKNGLHTATVQISTSPTHPYVSILIDGGVTSHVNTRPPNRDVTLP